MALTQKIRKQSGLGIIAKKGPQEMTVLLKARALETFGSEAKAVHWLNRPNHVFQGKTPLQAFKSSPADVEAELGRIDHGVYI